MQPIIKTIEDSVETVQLPPEPIIEHDSYVFTKRAQIVLMEYAINQLISKEKIKVLDIQRDYQVQDGIRVTYEVAE